MADGNFVRFFVMMNEVQQGYSVKSAPSGYCKVESVGGKAVFTVSIRSIKDGEYNVWGVAGDSAFEMGCVKPMTDGNVYVELGTASDNVFDSGTTVADLCGVYVLDGDRTVLCGYVNKNSSTQKREEWDECVNNATKTATAEPDTASEPMEIMTMNDEESDDLPQDDDEDGSSTEQGGITSYIDTIARLYNGLMSGKERREEKHEETRDRDAKERHGSYRELTEDHYRNACDGEFIQPFAVKQNNSKWSRRQNGCGVSLFGTVYEEGAIKYVVNGIATTVFAFCVPCDVEHSIWLPAAENCDGITGYWLTFVDAEDGRVVYPDIAIL